MTLNHKAKHFGETKQQAIKTNKCCNNMYTTCIILLQQSTFQCVMNASKTHQVAMPQGAVRLKKNISMIGCSVVQPIRNHHNNIELNICSCVCARSCVCGCVCCCLIVHVFHCACCTMKHKRTHMDATTHTHAQHTSNRPHTHKQSREHAQQHKHQHHRTHAHTRTHTQTHAHIPHTHTYAPTIHTSANAVIYTGDVATFGLPNAWRDKRGKISTIIVRRCVPYTIKLAVHRIEDPAVWR